MAVGDAIVWRGRDGVWRKFGAVVAEEDWMEGRVCH